MKKYGKYLTAALVVILLFASYFAGSCVKEAENAKERSARCGILISFALDKAENGDLNDESTMKALVSNVYAAYEMCDDRIVSSQLHDLWNVIIHYGDDTDAIRDIAVIELNDALRAVLTGK